MAFLDIVNVSKKYEHHLALDRVSFEVEKGSIYGLLGPNGAGKTSLIRIITQITAPDEGEIFFSGEKLNLSHISKIGYLPEERGLYKKMEVGEQALYFAQLKGLSKSDAIKKLKFWFEKFEIKSWWDKRIEELSKGMQQKVQFITTVIHEPELLILDEPFTGFDPINAELIKQEVLRLRQQGSTILFSTHRMESVEELCTHIALINKSKKILEGSVKKIRASFKSNIFEIHYEGNVIAFANALWSDFELLSTRDEGTHHVAVVKLSDGKKPNDLLNALLPHCQIIGFHEVIPSINDIFIKAVQGNSGQSIKTGVKEDAR